MIPDNWPGTETTIILTCCWTWLGYLQPGFEFLHGSADTVCQTNSCSRPSQKWNSACFCFPFCLHHRSPLSVTFALGQVCQVCQWQSHGSNNGVAMGNSKDFCDRHNGRTETWRCGTTSLASKTVKYLVVDCYDCWWLFVACCFAVFLHLSASGCLIMFGKPCQEQAIEAWPFLLLNVLRSIGLSFCPYLMGSTAVFSPSMMLKTCSSNKWPSSYN